MKDRTKFDQHSEAPARATESTTARRSFLAQLGGVAAGAALLPLANKVEAQSPDTAQKPSATKKQTKTMALILGATGNLSRLTAAFLSTQHPEVALRLTSSREAGVESLRSAFPSAEVMRADWKDEASLVAAMRGVDKVQVITPDGTDENVVTPNIIRAAKKAGGISQIVRLIILPQQFKLAELTPAQLATRLGPAMHGVAKPLLDASGLPVTYINTACWIMFGLKSLMAAEIKANRSISMPAKYDAPRPWLAESDIAEVFGVMLASPAAANVGREHLITAEQRYTFPQLAAVVGEAIGQKVAYRDSDATLRQVLGPDFDVLMTYFSQETPTWPRFPSNDTVRKLLGRSPVTVRRYVEENKSLFV